MHPCNILNLHVLAQRHPRSFDLMTICNLFLLEKTKHSLCTDNGREVVHAILDLGRLCSDIPADIALELDDGRVCRLFGLEDGDERQVEQGIQHRADQRELMRGAGLLILGSLGLPPEPSVH